MCDIISGCAILGAMKREVAAGPFNGLGTVIFAEHARMNGRQLAVVGLLAYVFCATGADGQG